ncbi:universal stress protein [Actinomycetospora soli]|uniref:universal stress protein n=1 Tax=Actinomycetospora soli TaxID=2893887 RepID=UPI001E383763|nr:universal stress protein [Actinomycetospora soli]MCD2187404.1 universal stress protein [Actinomycetospora soli]
MTSTAPEAGTTLVHVVRVPSPHAVVVGLDGSAGSRAALEYALDEAALRGLPVAGAVAWTPPEAWMTPYPMITSARDLQAAAIDLARNQIGEVLAGRSRRGASAPPVELVAASGPAAVVLERLSAGAALLVVGHRGRGAIASRLIGSIGLSAVVHARCTVVVVRPPDAPEASDEEGGAS